MKKVLVLGSTGSIGKQALEVIAETPGLEVAGLAAGTSHKLLVKQATESGASHVAILDENAASKVIEELPGVSVLSGPGCIRGLVDSVDCDIVLNAVVGAAGLEATMATLDRGIDLALANKESLVVAGSLIMETASRKGIRILPVDSEHSAIFQCLQGQEEGLERIFLTASGGPFFGLGRDRLEKVTRDDALNHPRWKMGSKISIDSATLMNKGLEVIEAHHLFGTGYDEIDVLVHPQSVVHSLVRFRDGSVLAQMGLPSMKLPIAYALNYPERLPVVMPQLDLIKQGELSFFKPDLDAFPCLEIAIEAGRRGGGAPIAVNAANEIAVAAFLGGRIRFLEIPGIIEKTLAAMDGDLASAIAGLEDIAEVDTAARRQAESLIT
ncbi:MAG: 1-deoxy-D-xylulose-5-phosphate reductoisomerase [Thermoleophilia bacterium]|nr:1-deoxy-D-xylulose-5-phosphate reductoisomerase [Thermoleophilia bacterium]